MWKKFSKQKRSILILDTEIDDSEHILTKSYNSNTESGQLNTLYELSSQLYNLELEVRKHIFSGDFNLHFKGCVRYIFASLLFKSKKEHSWN